MNNQIKLGPDLIIEGGDYVIDTSKKQHLSANGHRQDGLGTLQGKLPWHPTFSKESPYSTPQNPGGDWKQITDANGKASWSYTPSQEQIQAGNTKHLQEYMDRVEPGSTLLAPPPYGLGVFGGHAK